ncbi:MAG: hypothetical protein M3405_13735 [Acidobacteriota bacterium]|jgi:hypothetical protein|nr:hypothetical protein [Acidobacteriota bacterium]
MKKKIISLIIVIFATANFANAQTAEIKISLNEQFFDALLESVFKNLKPPKISLAELEKGENNRNAIFQNASFPISPLSTRHSPLICDESIRLLRETNGVKTAVRFRQGKIYVPIAFDGNYNPPLVGCIEFQGWAETNIELAFDRNKQALVGNARVLNINLNGAGGLGGEFLGRLVQSSIDKKINPIEIVKMDKISFTFPIRDSGNLSFRALEMRHKVNDKSIDVYVKYRFN